jgi:hypothetical protein
MSDNITGKDFRAAEGVGGWRIITDGATAFYPTESFQAAARLVAAIGATSTSGGTAAGRRFGRRRSRIRTP